MVQRILMNILAPVEPNRISLGKGKQRKLKWVSLKKTIVDTRTVNTFRYHITGVGYVSFKASESCDLINCIKFQISAQKTATGTFSNVITQIQNLPTMELGRKFRTPCKTGNRCGKVYF